MESLKALPSESVDAIVTDPPYELGFMGKKWDASGIAYNVELWAECLRVLKSGGHLLAFSGTRTYHRMAVAIEDAGFEVRDMLEWVYASGFPKSHNISKAIDKMEGAEMEVVGKKECGYQVSISKTRLEQGHRPNLTNSTKEVNITAPATEKAKEWDGWGSALKPAHEPICMARKPLSEKTIVENVLKHGTGAIDIDGCRIPTSEGLNGGAYSNNREVSTNKVYGEYQRIEEDFEQPKGRFPANIICTDDALGEEKSRYFDIDVWAEKHGLLQFPKASKAERNKGCEGLGKHEENLQGLDTRGRTLVREDGTKTLVERWKGKPSKNHHPTVKPVHLMAWLIRLVSKEGDIVLDPFGGSGTTGVACNMLNRKFILMEQSEEYVEIIKSRTNTQPTLFNQ